MISQEQFDEILANAPATAHNPPPVGGWACTAEELRELFELIPNGECIHREGWVSIGHWAKGLCPEGRSVFVEWTLTWEVWKGKPPAGEADGAGHSWDGFGNSGLLSQGGSLRALAQRIAPEGFRQWDARWVFHDGVEHPEPPYEAARVQFKCGVKGAILSLAENAKRGIVGLGVGCTYDAFHHRVYLGGEVATDTIVLLLRDRLTRSYGKEYSLAQMWEAVLTLGHINAFNPVCDMLGCAEALWDGVPRLDRLGPDYFHSEDSEYARMCFRKTMIAAVRRARSPGCKFDQILVTESPEGWNKSSAWELLAGRENFSDASILGRDARAAQEEMGDIWILEIAELSGLGKADVEHVKAFASRTNDRARPAYGRVLIDQLRQCIVVGTTNAEMYLLSMTGNRRFWTVKLHQPIELERLSGDRLQLWGEAAAMESEGESLVLPRHLWDVATAEQEKRRVVDVWEDELANLEGSMFIKVVNGKEFISNVSVSEYLNTYRKQNMNSGSGRKIADIMKVLGWKRGRATIDGNRVRGYEREIKTETSASVLHLSDHLSPKKPK